MNDLRLDPENTIHIQIYNLLSDANIIQNINLRIIKSSVMFGYSEECRQEKIFLDTGTSCCKWCLNTWSPGNFSFSLQPPKHASKELRRLLKKDILSLNKFQQRLIAKVRSTPLNNTLVMKCATCNKNTKIELKRSGKKKEVDKHESVGLEIGQESVKRKKKKKKPYAGLNPAVIESFNVSKKMTQLPKNIVTKTQSKKLNFKQQERINKEIENLKLAKKKSSNSSKPSLLSSFLESMAL